MSRGKSLTATHSRPKQRIELRQPKRLFRRRQRARLRDPRQFDSTLIGHRPTVNLYLGTECKVTDSGLLPLNKVTAREGWGMPSDLNRLRFELAVRLLQLSELDVVEAAELLVRHELQRGTGAVLEELEQELALAQEHLATSCNNDDLSRIAEAEERLCAISRQLMVVERQARVQEQQIQRQRSAYLTARSSELRHIRDMERLIGQMQSQPHP